LCPANETRSSSGDEIPNLNFLYGNIINVLQNTIDSHKNSATGQRGYVLEHRFTKFSEIIDVMTITPFKVFNITDFGTNLKLLHNFLLVINTNIPTISHHFQVMADYWSNFH